MAVRMSASGARCNEKGSRSCLFVAKLKRCVSGRRRGDGLLSVALAELLDPSGGIDDLLLARIERVTRRAHLDVQRLVDRRTRLERDAAAACHVDLAVLGMNVGFHRAP